MAIFMVMGISIIIIIIIIITMDTMMGFMMDIGGDITMDGGIMKMVTMIIVIGEMTK